MKNYLFIMQSLILIQLFPVFGQEIQSNAWNAFFSDFSLTSSTTIRTEIHYRSVDFYSTKDQILFRPQIKIKIAPGMISDLYTAPETEKKQSVKENKSETKGGMLSGLLGKKK